MAVDAMLGLGDDYRAYRLRPRRQTLRDLHGPFSARGPIWPAPYRYAIESKSQRQELGRRCEESCIAWWQHGVLQHVATDELKSEMALRWGEGRTRDARVGVIEPRLLPPEDAGLMRAFCRRGWQRLLVRAFEHVGVKAAGMGKLSAAGLGEFGALGEALLQARGRHRLAVLEELIQTSGSIDGLWGRLDAMDQALDRIRGGESWTASHLPGHVRSLWPMRNLCRLADRQGVMFREGQWKDYEAANTYAPEIRLLCLEPEIYGAGVEHDITHYLETVYWSADQVAFEVGNNGSEGDGQAMNNLILACHYEGPSYEGYAGWPGAQLFEWLERAFQVASFPQLFGVLRTFTIALHKDFGGDARAVLKDLVPGLVDGTHLDDLLRFFPGYVQHDHNFLGVMHARYQTPVFAQWRACFGAAITDSLETHVAACNDMLWQLEEIDLKSVDHRLLGSVTNRRALNENTGKKLVELRHLLELANAVSCDVHAAVAASLKRVIALDGKLKDLGREAAAISDGRSATSWARIEERYAGCAADEQRHAQELIACVARVQGLQAGWEDPIVRVCDDFLAPDFELFRGYYYEAAVHIGSDSAPGPKRLGEYETSL